MKDKLSNPKFLAQRALLVAVELVMKITGLGSVPIGPIYMSFLTLPVAIGAILMGPLAGAILGGVFGIASFIDAVSGAYFKSHHLRHLYYALSQESSWGS